MTKSAADRPDSTKSPTFLEGSLIAYALWLACLAYAMLFFGLTGALSRVTAIVWVIANIGVISRLSGPFQQGWREGLRAQWRNRKPLPLWGWGVSLLFAAFAAVALIGDFTPPTVNLEWDSLSYHLADPKLYVQAHRIYYLPWESHSNFAFTAEMWYTFALLFHSVPLAKLFHFSCAVGTSLAIYAIAARHLTPRIGVWAALLFASTPIVFWEAGTAYVDLASTFFATLTLLAVANGIAAREERWLWLGAVLMGLTLSTKATALTTLALYAVGLIYWRLRVAGQGIGLTLGKVALWCGVALLVGCPWYLKAWAYTGNPVYPFFFHIFGGRYWNAQLGADYDASNAAFGVGRRAVDALLVPWNLTMYLLPGHLTASPKPFNDFQTEQGALNPVLLAALFFPAFLRRKTSALIYGLAALALGTFVFWFATMQYIRYLLPVLPVLCLLAAWVLDGALAEKRVSGYALAGLTACSIAFSLFVGFKLAAVQAPVVFGLQSRDDYLRHKMRGYRAVQTINALPGKVKVAFYGYPFGFYCDREYLWADPNHSTVIPYDTLQTPDDLRQAFAKLGVTHLLIDTSAYVTTAPDAVLVYGLAAQCGPPITQSGSVVVFVLPGGKQ